MATPHITGSMALLRQLHPTWSVAELKALIMNTLTTTCLPVLTVRGRSLVWRASAPAVLTSRTQVRVRSSLSPMTTRVALVFRVGNPEVVGTDTETRTVRVVNKGVVDATYDLGYAVLTDVPGVAYSFPDGPTVSIPAGGSATFRIQLDANAAAMKHPRDATMTATQGANPRYYMSEESGYITLSPGSGTSLRLPVFAAPRPASNMSTNHNYVLFTGPTGSTNVGLTGQHVNTAARFPLTSFRS